MRKSNEVPSWTVCLRRAEQRNSLEGECQCRRSIIENGFRFRHQQDRTMSRIVNVGAIAAASDSWVPRSESWPIRFSSARLPSLQLADFVGSGD